ncbi:MAG: hypothetical protein KDC65_12960 [Saprospiraceae bacterium]|nr:hypothetical protein [Saprospiraceae bacterium]
MKDHPCTAVEFEALYMANLSAPDQPQPETAYLRTEASMLIQYGERKYKNYNSFKVSLHKTRSKIRNGAAPDKKQVLSTVMGVVNTYLCSIDLPFLIRYHQEMTSAVTQMEVFGPINNTYNPDQLKHLKRQADALGFLIKYMQNI